MTREFPGPANPSARFANGNGSWDCHFFGLEVRQIEIIVANANTGFLLWLIWLVIMSFLDPILLHNYAFQCFSSPSSPRYYQKVQLKSEFLASECEERALFSLPTTKPASVTVATNYLRRLSPSCPCAHLPHRHTETCYFCCITSIATSSPMHDTWYCILWQQAFTLSVR